MSNKQLSADSMCYNKLNGGIECHSLCDVCFAIYCNATKHSTRKGAGVWVKCSDRMPEKDGTYIVKMSQGSINAKIVVMESVFTKGEESVRDHWRGAFDWNYVVEWLDPTASSAADSMREALGICKSYLKGNGIKHNPEIYATIDKALQGQGDGWTRVEDGLPEVRKSDKGTVRVLAIVRGEGENVLSFFPKSDESDAKFYISIGQVFDECTQDVTHWRPLPPKPNEVK